MKSLEKLKNKGNLNKGMLSGGRGNTCLRKQKELCDRDGEKACEKKNPHSQHMKEAALSSGRDIYISESP